MQYIFIIVEKINLVNHVRSKECQTKKNETGLSAAHIKKEKLRQNVAIIFIRLTCRAIIILSVNHALKKNPDENMSFAIIAGQATRNSPIILAAFISCCSPYDEWNGFRKPADREAISSANGANIKGTPKCLTLLLQAKKE